MPARRMLALNRACRRGRAPAEPTADASQAPTIIATTKAANAYIWPAASAKTPPDLSAWARNLKTKPARW